MEKWTRICPVPTCNKEITYKTKDAYNAAVKKNTACRSCGTKSQYEKDPTKTKNMGDKNGRIGKSCYSIWVEKYGVEVANKKQQAFINKIKICSSGINNPMFGVSPSKHSGGGWCGTFESVFFRSLCELYFLVKFKRDNPDKSIMNAETKKYFVKYVIDDMIKTYRPDFVCDNVVYEIKSSRFDDERVTMIKANAAIKYFTSMGIEYRLVKDTFSVYQFIRYTLLDLVKSGHVILSDKTVLKLNRYAQISRFKLMGDV
jgi:hypothetical protein